MLTALAGAIVPIVLKEGLTEENIEKAAEFLASSGKNLAVRRQSIWRNGRGAGRNLLRVWRMAGFLWKYRKRCRLRLKSVWKNRQGTCIWAALHFSVKDR